MLQSINFSVLCSPTAFHAVITGDNLNYHDTTTSQGSPVSPFSVKWHIGTFFNYVSKPIPEIQLKGLTLGLHLMLKDEITRRRLT